MRYAQLVVGPAGSGKSTYCSTIVQHGEVEGKTIHVVNLDPAAEYFTYDALADIRELICVDDTMEDEDIHLGPNGGLIYCMEYLVENMDWLQEKIGEVNDDYILFDCPGQIELFTHMNAMKEFINHLKQWNFSVCSVFLIDSQFMVDGTKFISGTMAALSVMINLELPHVNVLSKMDLLSKSSRKYMDKFLEPDPHELLSDVFSCSKWGSKYKKLTESIGQVIEDYSIVRFYPLNVKNEDSISAIYSMINNAIQFGEDEDVKTKDFEYDDCENVSDDGL